MKFTVLWIPSAERDLAQIWLSANDRYAVASAAASIDTMLKYDPSNCGESRRTENLRVAFAPPLGIDFEILPNDRLVYVLAVWHTPS